MAVFPNKTIAQPTYNDEEYLEVRGYENYPKKSTQAKGFDPCSCVSYAKSLVPYRESIGVAKNWLRNTDKAQVGGVVILKESPSGHVAYITKVWADEFEVDETNYVPCTRSTRIIKKNYDKIIGYWVDE